ncbi:MAG: PEP-CTERM sorting domain-containing protein [Phycisphaerales bacterium]|nr:PEP-CTERM sorting domain-containing protein [Phycisphaerales bacterium]
MSRAKTMLALATAGVITMGWCGMSQAAPIATKDSALFSHLTEMNDGGNLSHNANTSEWTWSNWNGSNSLSGGFLNYSTPTTGTETKWSSIWTSTTFPSQVSSESGATVEIRLKVTGYLAPLTGTYVGTDAAISVLSSTGSHYGVLAIGASHIYMRDAAVGSAYDTDDNTDGYHVFRMADDPTTNKLSIWRDGVLIADNVAPTTRNPALDKQLYFGDGGSQFNGSASIDYVRWTAGAYAPVPEPGSVSMLAALAGLGLLRRP